MSVSEVPSSEYTKDSQWNCKKRGCTQYSQTLLVSTPGDPQNCYSLSVVLANHIDFIL